MSDELPEPVKDYVDKRLAEPDGKEWAKKILERAEQAGVNLDDD